jgi:hypothetical protein
MCLIGDLSHHPVPFFERPRSQFIYDLDPPQAAEARVRILGMLSFVTTAHLSLPLMVHEMNLLELPDRVDHLKRQQSRYPQMAWRKADAIAAHGKSGSFVGSECHLPWFS